MNGKEVYNIILYSSLSCGVTYFLTTLLSHNNFKYPLSLIMFLAVLVGLLHLSETGRSFEKIIHDWFEVKR